MMSWTFAMQLWIAAIAGGIVANLHTIREALTERRRHHKTVSEMMTMSDDDREDAEDRARREQETRRQQAKKDLEKALEDSRNKREGESWNGR